MKRLRRQLQGQLPDQPVAVHCLKNLCNRTFRLHLMSGRTTSAVRKRRIMSLSRSACAIAFARACASANSASSPSRLRRAVAARRNIAGSPVARTSSIALCSRAIASCVRPSAASPCARISSPRASYFRRPVRRLCAITSSARDHQSFGASHLATACKIQQQINAGARL